MTAILILERLRSAMPSAFATQPWEGISERYRYIPTVEPGGELGAEFLAIGAPVGYRSRAGPGGPR